jgi:hypothetical protein
VVERRKCTFSTTVSVLVRKNPVAPGKRSEAGNTAQSSPIETTPGGVGTRDRIRSIRPNSPRVCRVSVSVVIDSGWFGGSLLGELIMTMETLFYTKERSSYHSPQGTVEKKRYSL